MGYSQKKQRLLLPTWLFKILINFYLFPAAFLEGSGLPYQTFLIEKQCVTFWVLSGLNNIVSYDRDK